MKGENVRREVSYVGARHLAAIDISVREHTSLTDDAIGPLTDCIVTHNETR
jgi:hypothetical protein